MRRERYTRALITSREVMQRKCIDLENEIRGVRKVFGVKLPLRLSRGAFDRAVRDTIASDPSLGLCRCWRRDRCSSIPSSSSIGGYDKPRTNAHRDVPVPCRRPGSTAAVASLNPGLPAELKVLCDAIADATSRCWAWRTDVLAILDDHLQRIL